MGVGAGRVPRRHAHRFRDRAGDPLVGWATLAGLVVAVFFFGLMLGPANPFTEVAGRVPADGAGPNPLLENHPLMAFHPPVLYLGYVGFTIPFAFAVAALATGAGGDDGPPSPAAWTARLSADVRCPTCEGLSAAESAAPAAAAVRQEIRRRVDAGESDSEIRAFLVSRYGKDIVLTPEGTGAAALVWVLPVMAVVLGAGGLAFTFRRRRASGTAAATAEDRRLVEQALRRGLTR